MKQRNIGIDITRIIAFLFVPSVHFLLIIGFYDKPVIGGRMYIMTVFRTLFMTCVPLFMLISGYLYIERKIEINKNELKKFYLKIFSVLIPYVLSTIIIVLFNIFILNESISFKMGIDNILSYKQYAWYVNMYLGLYLIIPFLNKMWNSISEKEGHRILLIICLLLTALPSLVNVYDFESIQIFLKPWNYNYHNQLIPNWWVGIYPITYYYIGAYIKKYVDFHKISTFKSFGLLMISILIFSAYNIWRSYGINFVLGEWCDWGGYQNVVDATLFFLFINSLKVNVPYRLKKHLIYFSSLTFSAYLLSYIPDHFIYISFLKDVLDPTDRINYFPIYVMGVIIISLLLASIVNLLSNKILNCRIKKV